MSKATKRVFATILFGAPIYLIYAGVVGWTVAQFVAPPIGPMVVALLTILPLWVLGFVWLLRVGEVR